MEQVQYTKTVPVIGAYDVVVCGAGPAGWVAAVCCARRGKRTALIESLAFPGGGAAMTYVAALVVSIASLLRLILRARSRR